MEVEVQWAEATMGQVQTLKMKAQGVREEDVAYAVEEPGILTWVVKAVTSAGLLNFVASSEVEVESSEQSSSSSEVKHPQKKGGSWFP
jgi:uncharacterized protein (DUF2236 family)